MNDELPRLLAVVSGEVSRLVAAYGRAVWGVSRIRARLVAAGVDPGDLSVAAGVGEKGEPVVHVTVLPVIAVELSALIANDVEPPRRRPSAHPCRDDPNVA